MSTGLINKSLRIQSNEFRNDFCKRYSRETSKGKALNASCPSFSNYREKERVFKILNKEIINAYLLYIVETANCLEIPHLGSFHIVRYKRTTLLKRYRNSEGWDLRLVWVPLKDSDNKLEVVINGTGLRITDVYDVKISKNFKKILNRARRQKGGNWMKFKADEFPSETRDPQLNRYA